MSDPSTRSKASSRLARRRERSAGAGRGDQRVDPRGDIAPLLGDPPAEIPRIENHSPRRRRAPICGSARQSFEDFDAALERAQLAGGELGEAPFEAALTAAGAAIASRPASVSRSARRRRLSGSAWRSTRPARTNASIARLTAGAPRSTAAATWLSVAGSCLGDRGEQFALLAHAALAAAVSPPIARPAARSAPRAPVVNCFPT